MTKNLKTNTQTNFIAIFLPQYESRTRVYLPQIRLRSSWLHTYTHTHITNIHFKLVLKKVKLY